MYYCMELVIDNTKYCYTNRNDMCKIRIMKLKYISKTDESEISRSIWMKAHKM